MILREGSILAAYGTAKALRSFYPKGSTISIIKGVTFISAFFLSILFVFLIPFLLVHKSANKFKVLKDDLNEFLPDKNSNRFKNSILLNKFFIVLFTIIGIAIVVNQFMIFEALQGQIKGLYLYIQFIKGSLAITVITSIIASIYFIKSSKDRSNILFVQEYLNNTNNISSEEDRKNAMNSIPTHIKDEYEVALYNYLKNTKIN